MQAHFPLGSSRSDGKPQHRNYTCGNVWLADTAANQAGTLTSRCGQLPPVVLRTVLPTSDGVGRRDFYQTATHWTASTFRATDPLTQPLEFIDKGLKTGHIVPAFLIGRSDRSPTILSNGLLVTSSRMGPNQGFRPCHLQETPGQNFSLTRLQAVAA